MVPWSYLLVTALAGPATGLLLICQILWRPRAYARHRTNLLTCVRLLRGTVGVAAGLHFGPQLAEDWQRGPNRDSLVVLLPVWKVSQRVLLPVWEVGQRALMGRRRRNVSTVLAWGFLQSYREGLSL